MMTSKLTAAGLVRKKKLNSFDFVNFYFILKLFNCIEIMQTKFQEP